MSDDGTAYTYINIGVNLTPSKGALAYTYINIGFVGARSYIGKVVGFAARPLIHMAALMQNLGIMLLIPGKDGIAVVTTNVIDYVVGGVRLLEDGTDRLDEDGITTRITE